MTIVVADPATVMRRWFTEGWAGSDELADEIFSDSFSSNGVTVGPAGPKRNISERVLGFPDLATYVEEILRVEDTITVLRLRWTGTHTGPYLGVSPTGRRVEVRGMTTWRFERGTVVEDWTAGHIPLAIFGVEIPPPVPITPPRSTENAYERRET